MSLFPLTFSHSLPSLCSSNHNFNCITNSVMIYLNLTSPLGCMLHRTEFIPASYLHPESSTPSTIPSAQKQSVKLDDYSVCVSEMHEVPISLWHGKPTGMAFSCLTVLKSLNSHSYGSDGKAIGKPRQRTETPQPALTVGPSSCCICGNIMAVLCPSQCFYQAACSRLLCRY